VMGAVEAKHSGTASGVNNAVSRVAGLLAIAVLGIVMVSAFSSSLDNRLTSLKVAPSVQHQIDSQRVRLGDISIPSVISHDEKNSLEQAIAESFVTGFRVVMLIGAGLALASSLTALILIEGKKQSSSAKKASTKREEDKGTTIRSI